MKFRRQFEFSAERLSENAKCIKIIVFAELLTAISSIYVESLQQIVNKNIKTHYIPKKNATLTPNSCDFYDLLTFVAKFCGQNLRTFSADFCRLKSKIRRLLYFQNVCPETKCLLTGETIHKIPVFFKGWLPLIANFNFFQHEQNFQMMS